MPLDISDTIRDSLISIGRSDAAAARLEGPTTGDIIRFAWLTYFLGKAERAADDGDTGSAGIWFDDDNQAELAIVERKLDIGNDFTRKGEILRERIESAAMREAARKMREKEKA